MVKKNYCKFSGFASAIFFQLFATFCVLRWTWLTPRDSAGPSRSINLFTGHGARMPAGSSSLEEALLPLGGDAVFNDVNELVFSKCLVSGGKYANNMLSLQTQLIYS